MRTIGCFALLVTLTSFGFAEGLGKTKKYKKADLPKSVTVDTSDIIVVIETPKPGDIKIIKTSSSNPEIKVRAVDMDGEVRIIITGDKKGDSKVGWGWETKDGKNGGVDGLLVHIN